MHAPTVTTQPLRLLQATAVLFVLLKLLYFVLLPPIGDEAYYWLWGQHPALSYFDHPPLHAWLLGLVSLVFGWNLYSLRLLTWVTFAINAWVFWQMAKRLAPENPRPWFWTTLLIYMGSPIMLVLGAISFHDHLLITLCLLSGYCFVGFTDDWNSGKERFGRLYLAGLFLGLAVLTKYNGALLGLGFLLVIVSDRGLRPLLLRWQTYLAGFLAIVIQAPVLYWNISNGFASYRFHAVDRWNGHIEFSPDDMAATLIASAIILTPFLVWPLIRTLRPEGTPFERRLREVAGAAFGLSTLAIAVLSAIVDVPNYWNVVAYPLAFPLLVKTIRTRVTFWLHLLAGATLTVLFLIEMGFSPIVNLPGLAFGTAYSNYDWDRVAGIVAAAQKDHPGTFLGATRYTTAAQLAFALKNPDVTDISDRPSEFTYWFDKPAHRGQSAIVLAAPFIPISYASTEFRHVTLLENIQIHDVFGAPAGTYQLYFAEDYCGGVCG